MEWRADAGDDDDLPLEERVVRGRITTMPEYTLEFPLWDEEGPIEERELLERELGLSAALIDDLARWQDEWDRVCSGAVSDDTQPVKPLPAGWSADHAARGRDLFVRLREEIEPRFEVRFHP
jgi:hypothetical protein